MLSICYRNVVPKVRVELTRSCPHRFLRPARLPFRHFGTCVGIIRYVCWDSAVPVRYIRYQSAVSYTERVLMPILYRADAKTEEGYPGIPRTILVDASHGAQSLWVGHLEIEPGARVTTHIHPDTEEAMVIVEGELEAVLGDEVVTLGPGDTVLAPAGVKHGFVNRSGANAALLASFPKTSFERLAAE